MSKDRARPFSRKHRKYWIPVTGGMLLIGVLNVGIGFCAYEKPPPPPERIELTLPAPTPAPVARLAPGAITLGSIPAVVMRAFAVAYPRHVPSGAKKLVATDGTTTYEISFTAPTRTVVYREDGTFVSER